MKNTSNIENTKFRDQKVFKEYQNDVIVFSKTILKNSFLKKLSYRDLSLYFQGHFVQKKMVL